MSVSVPRGTLDPKINVHALSTEVVKINKFAEEIGFAISAENLEKFLIFIEEKNTYKISPEGIEELYKKYFDALLKYQTKRRGSIAQLEAFIHARKQEIAKLTRESNKETRRGLEAQLLTAKKEKDKGRETALEANLKEANAKLSLRNRLGLDLITHEAHLDEIKKKWAEFIQSRDQKTTDFKTKLKQCEIPPIVSEELKPENNVVTPLKYIYATRAIILLVAVGGPLLLWNFKKSPNSSQKNVGALVQPHTHNDSVTHLIIPMSEAEIAQVRKERESETDRMYLSAKMAATRQTGKNGGLSSFRATLESEIRKSFGQLIKTVHVEESKNDLGEPAFRVYIMFHDGLELHDDIEKTPKAGARDMAKLLQEKPEEIINNIELHQKIRQAWSEMCKNKEDELFDIYFQTGGKCEEEIIKMFADYFPGITKISPGIIKIRGIAAFVGRTSNSPEAQESFGLQLCLETRENATLLLADGMIGTTSEYFDRLTQSTVDRIQEKLFADTDKRQGGFGGNILDITKNIRAELEHAQLGENMTRSGLIVEENRTDMKTGIISSTVLYNGPGGQRRGILQFHIFRTDHPELERNLGHAMKIIHEEIRTRKGDFSVLDNWGEASKENEKGPQKMQLCTKRICELLLQNGIMKPGTTVEYLGSTTQHVGDQIVSMKASFRFVVNGTVTPEIELYFDLRGKK